MNSIIVTLRDIKKSPPFAIVAMKRVILRLIVESEKVDKEMVTISMSM